MDEDSRTETIVDSPALRNEGEALIMQYEAERRNRKNSPPNTTTVPEDTAAKLRALGYTD